MSENVMEFSDGNFQDEVLSSDVPVLVDSGLSGVDRAVRSRRR